MPGEEEGDIELSNWLVHTQGDSYNFISENYSINDGCGEKKTFCWWTARRNKWRATEVFLWTWKLLGINVNSFAKKVTVVFTIGRMRKDQLKYYKYRTSCEQCFFFFACTYWLLKLRISCISIYQTDWWISIFNLCSDWLLKLGISTGNLLVCKIQWTHIQIFTLSAKFWPDTFKIR